MEEQSKSSTKAIVGLIVVVLLVIAATTAVVMMNNDGSKKPVASTSSTASAATTSNSSTASSFKDGTYDATGVYNSPGGEESIDVKLTLKDNTVSDVSVVPHSNVAEAAEYQSKFVSGYKSQVVGKKINEISLSRVAGSSLTSIGFNSALDQIKSEAAA